MKLCFIATFGEKYLPHIKLSKSRKNGSSLEQGLASTEDDVWFLTAAPVDLQRFLAQCEVLRYHEAIIAKVDSRVGAI